MPPRSHPANFWTACPRSGRCAAWTPCSPSIWTAPMCTRRTGCRSRASSRKITPPMTASSSHTARIRWRTRRRRSPTSSKTAPSPSCSRARSAPPTRAIRTRGATLPTPSYSARTIAHTACASCSTAASSWARAPKKRAHAASMPSPPSTFPPSPSCARACPSTISRGESRRRRPYFTTRSTKTCSF